MKFQYLNVCKLFKMHEHLDQLSMEVSDTVLREHIHQQRQYMEKLQGQFVQALNVFQKEFDNYVADSSEVQSQMLQRIQDLKEELQRSREEANQRLLSRKSTQASTRSKLYGHNYNQGTSPKKGSKSPRKLSKSSNKNNGHENNDQNDEIVPQE